MTNCCQTIKFLRALEAKLGITLFKNELANFAKLDDQTFEVISHVFKVRRANPSNQAEASKLYSTIASKIAFENMARATEWLRWNSNAIAKRIDLSAAENAKRTGYH
jgi:hypothetical protein